MFQGKIYLIVYTALPCRSCNLQKDMTTSTFSSCFTVVPHSNIRLKAFIHLDRIME